MVIPAPTGAQSSPDRPWLHFDCPPLALWWWWMKPRPCPPGSRRAFGKRPFSRQNFEGVRSIESLCNLRFRNRINRPSLPARRHPPPPPPIRQVKPSPTGSRAGHRGPHQSRDEAPGGHGSCSTRSAARSNPCRPQTEPGTVARTKAGMKRQAVAEAARPGAPPGQTLADRRPVSAPGHTLLLQTFSAKMEPNADQHADQHTERQSRLTRTMLNQILG